MPSVKNPNKKSHNRMVARAAHQRSRQQKRSAAGRVARTGVSKASARQDTTRGARPGLLPTSGPRAPLSAKKQKKVIQRMTLALQRRIAVEGADAVLGPAPAEAMEVEAVEAVEMEVSGTSENKTKTAAA